MNAATRWRIRLEAWRDSWTARLIVLGLVILAVLAFCRPKPAPIPAREQHSIDSLAITKPQYDFARRVLVVHETTYVAASTREQSHAVKTNHVADSIHAAADSAERLARNDGDDTTSAWFHIAELREIESDSLRSVIRYLNAALLHQTRARVAADSGIALADARALALENLNQRLARDIVRGDCRLAYVLRCPSRKEVAVITAVGTYALTRKDVRGFLTLHLLK